MTILGTRAPSEKGYEIDLFHCYDTNLTDLAALVALVQEKGLSRVGLCVGETFADAALKALDYAHGKGELLVCEGIDQRVVTLYSQLLYAYTPRVTSEQVEAHALAASIANVATDAIKLIVHEWVKTVINQGVFTPIEALQKEVPLILEHLTFFSEQAFYAWRDYYVKTNRPYITDAMVLMMRRDETTQQLQQACQAAGLNPLYVIGYLGDRLGEELTELQNLFEHNPMICPYILSVDKHEWWQGVLMATGGDQEGNCYGNSAKRSGYEWAMRWLKENPLI